MASTYFKPNTIYCGDCLFVMGHDIPSGSVDLIYLDPPFFTGKIQKGAWNPEAMEVSFEDSKKFWSSQSCAGAPAWMKHIAANEDRRPFAAYLWYMQCRLALCKKVLKNTGSIYLHCDYRASHYLKMVMDGIFGYDNFRNEIVWWYPGGLKAVPNYFPRKHDTIFWYTKSDQWKFKVQRKTVEKNALYSRWIKYSKDGLTVLFKDFPRTDKVKFQDYLKRFKARYGKAPEPNDIFYEFEGALVDSVWGDAPSVFRLLGEKIGYPTQKPEKLLERIISASSGLMDVILDPFCGCGTAIAVAQKLGRRWIGIDINSQAYRMIQKRFKDDPEIGIDITVIPRNFTDVMKLKESDFEAWVNDFYSATKPSPDRGVDGITKDGIPIQTKAVGKPIGYDKISQFVNDAKYHPQVPRPLTRVIFVSQSGFDDSARARVFEIEENEKIKVELVEPKTILPEEKGV